MASSDRLTTASTVIGKCRSNAGLDFIRVLQSDPEYADGLGHVSKIRILKLRSGGQKAGRFLLELKEAEGLTQSLSLHASTSS